MRILHIIDSMGLGGAQSLLTDLVPAQKELGHEVRILQLVESKNSLLLDRAQAAGIEILTASKRLSIYNPLMIFRILPYLKKYDVINVHLFPANYWVGLAHLLSFCSVPIVYTVHSSGGHKRANLLLKKIEKYLYRLSYSQIIACSEIASAKFQELFPNVKVCTVPNGINISRFAKAEPYSKKELIGVDDCIVVSMVSRFASMKRQDVIVQAIAKLPSKYHAVFVGSDEGFMNKVKEIAISENVLDRVHFLGARSDINRILKTSDIIVLASNFEGLSLSSIEAMAAGKPFLVSNADGLREVVKGVSETFENDNPESLSLLLKNLIDDEEIYKNVSTNCYIRAMEYDISKTASNYIATYNKIKKNDLI